MSDETRVDALERRVEMLEALVLQLQRASSLQPAASHPQSHQGRTVAVDMPKPRSWPVGLDLSVDPPDPTWIPILHRMARPIPGWPAPCGDVGLYLTDPPREHEPASLEKMRIRGPGELDWRPPQRGIDEPRCSSCLAAIDPFSNADLDYLSHMLPGDGFATLPSTTPPKRRRKSGGRASPSPPSGTSGGVSPGLPGADLSLSTFSGLLMAHTPQASLDVMEDLENIKKLAEQAGLFDDRRLS